MRFLTLIAFSLFLVSQHPAPTPAKVQQPKQQQSQPASKRAADDQGSTEQSPIFVKIIPPLKTQPEIDQDAKDRNDKATHERWTIWLTVFLALVAAGQLWVYTYQAGRLKETVDSAKEQSKAMGRHIEEATRSANAMEEIATVIETGNAAVVRAYLSVVIGHALYQDRQDNTKFEGKPNLVNTGSTPARNVHVRIAAEVIAPTDAEKFTYPLPEEHAKAPAVAAPHQTYMLSAIVKDFVPDFEVSAIKTGQGKALTVWGVITYDDIFGKNHTTKFGQWLFWYPDQKVYGFYIPGQNDMD